jgi:hypothetical protein
VIDGQIDYSNYSRDELIDCITHVDSRRFPMNHANTLLELSKRPPPKSVSVDAATPTLRSDTSKLRRPIAVWIIAVFYLLGSAVLMPVYIAVRGGWLHIPMTPAAQAFIDKLNVIDDISCVIAVTLTTYAAISLLRLQRKAFYLFSAAFGCNVLMMMYTASRGLLTQRYFETMFGLLVLLMVCAYSRSLMNRRVLL